VDISGGIAMAFGRQLPEAQPTNRGRYGLSLWGLAVALFALLLAGCGGGSSSGNNNNGGGPNPTDPTITGRVVDQYSNFAPVAGVGVTVRNAGGTVIGTTVTNATGNFSIQIRPTTSASTVSFSPPSGLSFYSQGYVNSTAFILSSGTSVPALAATQTFPLGDVVVLSETGGPPPPPF
jgi:hypothetical protein